KFAADNDDLITRRLAGMGVWKAPVETHDFVLEGGGIEVDGEGTLLTTERCLLAPTRNPTFTQSGIENYLAPLLGTRRVLWLKHGDLLGDDTDGHIDTLARFCSPGLIAYQGCDDPSDPHFEELSFMEAELEAFRRANGEPYELVPLPLPDPIFDDDGERLPAGYANFLIVNGGVLVPVYGVSQDLEALRRLRPCFPNRRVVPVDCRWLIRQYGSLHCVTMQIPAAPG
ncbi:MAG TPA: agmatine deiminase family protein, partial [Nevskiaceae bacterium]|nr:agmatine deiminase family protein [Nevskiaceae bacterium]